MDISPTVLRQLEEAQAAIETSAPLAGPPIATQAIASEADVFGFTAAGSGQVAHVLVDHYFANANAYLWVFAANAWRYTPLTADDEPGIAKVAFEADRVDAWWNDNNKLTMLRCWKTF